MRNFLHIITIFVLLLACSIASAQEMPPAQTKPKSTTKTPMTIKGDSISIDIDKNVAIFAGNVKSCDGETTITCRKMTIYLENKKTGDASIGESKQISRILCEGEVVIVTKTQDGKPK